jgi:hypothetical protein
MKTFVKLVGMMKTVRDFARTASDKRRLKNWHRERHQRRVR